MSNNSYVTRLNNLRDLFTDLKVDGFLFTTKDEYINEYVPSYARRVEYLSGFSGSFALVIVLKKRAAIFVDGRYTLQVKEEVDSTLFDALPYDLENISAWLKENGDLNAVIGINTKVVTLNEINLYEKLINENNLKTAYIEKHLVDSVWENPPAKIYSQCYVHDIEFCGVSFQDKLKFAYEELQKTKIDFVLVTALDSIAWLLNIRGDDVEDTPLNLAHVLLSRDGKCFLFMDEKKITPELKAYFGDRVQILLPSLLEEKLEISSKNTKVKINISLNSPAYFIFLLRKFGFEVEFKEDFCQLIKAKKNSVEIKNTEQAHIRDGLALTKLIYTLNTDHNQDFDELNIDIKLKEMRMLVDSDIFKVNRYRGTSFSSIIGVNGNGAIIHYRSSSKTNTKLDNNGYLLIDCGAQYVDGTTDVTRTLSFNKQSEEFKKHFTLVLKGHIAVANLNFKKGTKGNYIDVLARKFLWQEGLDYAHGTGHGVGFFLGVHEGPISIAPIKEAVFEEGMIVSNEPGYYLQNEYGIRLENLYVVEQSKKYEDFWQFKCLTMAPFDMKNVVLGMLDESEKEWLDNYHQDVYSKFSPYLSEEEKSWLKAYTKI